MNGREGVKKEGSEKKEDSQKRRKRKISKHLGKYAGRGGRKQQRGRKKEALWLLAMKRFERILVPFLRTKKNIWLRHIYFFMKFSARIFWIMVGKCFFSNQSYNEGQTCWDTSVKWPLFAKWTYLSSYPVYPNPFPPKSMLYFGLSSLSFTSDNIDSGGERIYGV